MGTTTSIGQASFCFVLSNYCLESLGLDMSEIRYYICRSIMVFEVFERSKVNACAGVAQLVERKPSKLDVAGSTPVSRSSIIRA